MELYTFDDKEIMSEQLASWIESLVQDTLKKQDLFTLVLSGGGTPKLLFEKLASDKYKDKIDWKRVHIFWGDERVVPFEDDRNNAKMAYDILINHINVPPEQVHIMRTDIEPKLAAEEYQKILHHYFDNTSNSFDLVLLGMGDDGHTLSLFPGSPIIEEHERWVNSVYNEQQKMYRITLMPAIVNKASNIAFMVEGAKKANVLQQVIDGPYIPMKLPAQIIKPVNGQLSWFLDKAAATELNQS
jgi:6-phosphogluconolactonase